MNRATLHSLQHVLFSEVERDRVRRRRMTVAQPEAASPSFDAREAVRGFGLLAILGGSAWLEYTAIVWAATKVMGY